ncbi:hypothetical protein FJU08_16100 [Martelella alba]|uniref:Uncharacterized protein n=1 Tax=Martelella alba TaxID=2590451 RepID=A0A506U4T6_9HYPH|nr:hypothetical protein [Martelella alba]TPW28850.1 hypothetical protein FJU08_16100 [Martelella alba]
MTTTSVKSKTNEPAIVTRDVASGVSRPSKEDVRERAQPKDDFVARRDTFAGSFSAMLTEAYDGDTAEQMHLLSHGVESEGHGGEDAEALEVSEVSERRRSQKTSPAERSEDSLLNRLRGKKEAESAEKVASAELAAPGKPKSLEAAQERFLLASTPMPISAIGTHVNLDAFSRLTDIFDSSGWKRDPHFSDAPLKANAA